MEKLLQQIEELLSKGHNKEALDFANSLVAENPTSEHFLVRGILHRLQTNFSLALNDLDRSIELDCYRVWARYQRAEVLFDLGRRQEGIEELTYLTHELAPNAYLYPYMLGVRLLSFPEYELNRAYIYLHASTVRNPTNDQAYRLLIEAYAASTKSMDPSLADSMNPVLAVHAIYQLQLLHAELKSEEYLVPLDILKSIKHRWNCPEEVAHQDMKLICDEIGIGKSETPSPSCETLIRSSNLLMNYARSHRVFRIHALPILFVSSPICHLVEHSGLPLKQGILKPIPTSLGLFAFNLVKYFVSDSLGQIFVQNNLYASEVQCIEGFITRAIKNLLPLPADEKEFAEQVASLVVSYAAIRTGLETLVDRFNPKMPDPLIGLLWSDIEAIRILSRESIFPSKVRPSALHWVFALRAYFTYLSIAFAEAGIKSNRLHLYSYRLSCAIKEVTEDNREAVDLNLRILESLEHLSVCAHWYNLKDAVTLQVDRKAAEEYSILLSELDEKLSPHVLNKEARTSARPDPFIHVLFITKYLRGESFPQQVIDHYAASAESVIRKFGLRDDRDQVLNRSPIRCIFNGKTGLDSFPLSVSVPEGGMPCIDVSHACIAAVDAIGSILEKQFIGRDVLYGKNSLETFIRTLPHAEISKAAESESASTLLNYQRLTEFKLKLYEFDPIKPSRIGTHAFLFMLHHECAHSLKRHRQIFEFLKRRVNFAVPFNGRKALEFEADSIALRNLLFSQKSHSWYHESANYLPRYDQLTKAEIERLLGVFLAFGLAQLHLECIPLKTNSETHPSLGARLKAIRTWSYTRRLMDDIYQSVAIGFVKACIEAAQLYQNPAFYSLCRPILDELESIAHEEFSESWKVMEAIDMTFYGIGNPTTDDQFESIIEEIGDRIRGINDDE